jgi:hypothetical protein
MGSVRRHCIGRGQGSGRGGVGTVSFDTVRSARQVMIESACSHGNTGQRGLRPNYARLTQTGCVQCTTNQGRRIRMSRLTYRN